MLISSETKGWREHISVQTSEISRNPVDKMRNSGSIVLVLVLLIASICQVHYQTIKGGWCFWQMLLNHIPRNRLQYSSLCYYYHTILYEYGCTGYGYGMKRYCILRLHMRKISNEDLFLHFFSVIFLHITNNFSYFYCNPFQIDILIIHSHRSNWS